MTPAIARPLGIDVSHHNGVVNWERVKKSKKIQFTFIKATEGMEGIDSAFQFNWNHSRWDGDLIRGAYHYGHIESDPVKQAAHFVDVVKDAGNGKEIFSVLLEAIQDPGNLGSILRSAAAASIRDVYLSPQCADAWSPKTLRAAMGAHFFLRIHENSDLQQVAQQFPGTVIATSIQASRNLFEIPLSGPTAFVFGNEGAGLSKELVQAVDENIVIPMPGKTESLNAAAAAANLGTK